MTTNKGLAALQPLVGEWDYTIYNAWFLDSMETTIVGKTFIERLHGSFLMMRGEFEGKVDDVMVIGYSDAREQYQLFYYDQRGVSRIFDMEFDGTRWSYQRQDPDFYQRFTAEVSAETITGITEASEDQGRTWRKDFNIDCVRVRRQE